MDFIYALLVLAGFLFGMFIGWRCDKSAPPISAPPSPRVVVNVPADFKVMEPIMVDGKPAVIGPRALLFYTVYTAAINAFTCDGADPLSTDEEFEAYESAARAVEKVYGQTFDS